MNEQISTIIDKYFPPGSLANSIYVPHCVAVTELALKIAKAHPEFKANPEILELGGMLHDIGMVYIPYELINKPGRLNEDELTLVKQHPLIAEKLLFQVNMFKDIIPIIRHHHEHFDGSGYPGALKGEEIPVEARILAIADAYDAITSIRPYHNQLTPQEALDELKRCAGTQFDPELVKTFCKAIENTLPKHIDVE